MAGVTFDQDENFIQQQLSPAARAVSGRDTRTSRIRSGFTGTASDVEDNQSESGTIGQLPTSPLTDLQQLGDSMGLTPEQIETVLNPTFEHTQTDAQFFRSNRYSDENIRKYYENIEKGGNPNKGLATQVRRGPKLIQGLERNEVGHTQSRLSGLNMMTPEQREYASTHGYFGKDEFVRGLGTLGRTAHSGTKEKLAGMSIPEVMKRVKNSGRRGQGAMAANIVRGGLTGLLGGIVTAGLAAPLGATFGSAAPIAKAGLSGLVSTGLEGMTTGKLNPMSLASGIGSSLLMGGMGSLGSLGGEAVPYMPAMGTGSSSMLGGLFNTAQNTFGSVKNFFGSGIGKIAAGVGKGVLSPIAGSMFEDSAPEFAETEATVSPQTESVIQSELRNRPKNRQQQLQLSRQFGI